MRKLLTYQIKQGDTLTSIAADFRISTAALIQANPSLQSGVIAGQRIVIPVCQTQIRSHIILQSLLGLKPLLCTKIIR